MNRKIMIILSSFLVLILIFTGNSIASVGSNYDTDGEDSNSGYEPLPNGNNLMERLRNRICDTLGICQGGCELVTITGILTYDGSNFYIDDIELHFGPYWFITAAESSIDYDNDGENELVYDELQGLVGTEVTIEGHMQSSDWMSVFTINGEVYREPGQPIWSSQHQWRLKNRHGPNKP